MTLLPLVAAWTFILCMYSPCILIFCIRSAARAVRHHQASPGGVAAAGSCHGQVSGRVMTCRAMVENKLEKTIKSL